MQERWRLLKCEQHGIQLGPKDTLRCGVVEDTGGDGPDAVRECPLLLEIIEVEEVRWPYGEPPPEALEVLVNAEASRIEGGMHPFNEASKRVLRTMIRPSAEADLEAILSALRAGWLDYAMDAKGEVETALGWVRMGETEGLELRMQTALDRLQRIIEGENYAERWAAFAAEHPGAVSFTPPPEEALPPAFQLKRFVAAQEDIYDSVLAELRAGEKEEHWMWFIFPQFVGLGSSKNARYYAIKSLREAQAYMGHSLLGARLLQCARELVALEGKTAADIFSEVDVAKLHASMTLFAIAAPEEGVFQMVLDRYFEGEADPQTTALVDA